MPGMLYSELHSDNSEPSPSSPSQNNVPSLVPIKACHKPSRQSQTHVEWMLRATQEAARPDRGYGDGDSEDDLAERVHDFMENGSHHMQEACEAIDADIAGSMISKEWECLQAVMAMKASVEEEVRGVVRAIIMGASECDLQCRESNGDGGHCIHSLVVKSLRISGYNANICRSKWQYTTKLPGGEYEYIDVCMEENVRIIIDLDFRAQFQIARPSQQYQALTKALPLVFVGKSSRLEKVLHVMSEAAKTSLHLNSMHIPPWRTLPYLHAKWLSPQERKGLDEVLPQNETTNWQSSHCKKQLRHLKDAMKLDMEKGLVLKPILNGLNRISKTRRGTHSS